MIDSWLRRHTSGIIDPLANFFIRYKVSPNHISFLSLLFALSAGILFYFSFSPKILLSAGFLTLLSAILDAVDGAIARKIGPTRKGDFLDHALDRYSDIFIICGISFRYAPLWIGIVAITGVLLTSYLGTQAQAVGIGRYYGGFLGRADRVAMIFLIVVANFFYPYEIKNLQLLGWMIVFIAVSSHITAIQRFFWVWKRI
jgi:CDP-diacylglycerol--glycerol-3-phosphate 3-phosphatidyltransferase